MAGTTFNIPDIGNDPRPVTTNPNGRFGEVDSKSVALSTQDKTVLDAINTNTAALTALLDALTDGNGNMRSAFYFGAVPVDPSAAGPIIGATAAGADIAFAPITQGGRVATAPQTALTAGKVTDAWFDPLGRQTMTYFPLDISDSQQSSVTNSTSPVTILAAATGGRKRHITVLNITNEHATQDTLISFSDGAKVRKWWAKAGQTVGLVTPGSPWKASTAATAWTATCAAANASAINFDVSFAEI